MGAVVMTNSGAVGASADLFYQVFQQSSDAILIARREHVTGDLLDDFIMRDANAAVEKLFGYSREQVVLGKPFREWAYMIGVEPGLLDSRLDVWRERLDRGEAVVYQELKRTAAGKPAFVEVHLRPLGQGSAPHLMCLYRDLTERCRLERLLRQVDPLRSLSEAAVLVHHRVKHLLETTIAYAASPGAAGASPPEKELQSIAEEALATGRLLDMLVCFSEGEGERREQHDLNDDVRLALELVNARLSSKGIVLEKNLGRESLMVNGDRGKIIHSIANLLRNAEDALEGRSRGRITVTTQTAFPHALLTVADNGAGIQSSQVGKIFQPFFTTREHRAGLGLAVAYDVVKSYGGYLRAESEEGRGSVLVVELPLARSATKTGPSKRILVLADEPRIARFLEQFLKSKGHSVQTAADGRTGLRIVEQEQPDIVILDLLIPGKDGMEVLSETKKINPQIAVIVVSAIESEEVKQHTLEAGAHAYIRDPFDVAALEQALSMLGPES